MTCFQFLGWSHLRGGQEISEPINIFQLLQTIFGEARNQKLNGPVFESNIEQRTVDAEHCSKLESCV